MGRCSQGQKAIPSKVRKHHYLRETSMNCCDVAKPPPDFPYRQARLARKIAAPAKLDDARQEPSARVIGDGKGGEENESEMVDREGVNGDVERGSLGRLSWKTERNVEARTLGVLGTRGQPRPPAPMRPGHKWGRRATERGSAECGVHSQTFGIAPSGAVSLRLRATADITRASAATSGRTRSTPSLWISAYPNTGNRGGGPARRNGRDFDRMISASLSLG